MERVFERHVRHERILGRIRHPVLLVLEIHAVPVDRVHELGAVGEVDLHPLPLLEPELRAGHLAVERKNVERVPGHDLVLDDLNIDLDLAERLDRCRGWVDDRILIPPPPLWPVRPGTDPTLRAGCFDLRIPRRVSGRTLR